MHAVRNVNLCNKDCICLFVCPTGATDTEDSQIDFAKCLDGCRLCVDACPSRAIYLVPNNYAPSQKKSTAVKKALLELAASKTKQEKIASGIAKFADNPVARQFAQAIADSNRISAEDCFREAGFMLPQSQEVKILLRSLLNNPQQENYPKEVAERLLELI